MYLLFEEMVIGMILSWACTFICMMRPAAVSALLVVVVVILDLFY